MAHASTQTDSVVSLAKSKVERGTHSTRLHRNSKVASSGKVGQYMAGCPWMREEGHFPSGYCHTPLRCGPEPRAKRVMDVPDESSTIGRSIPLLPQHLLTLQGPSKHFPLTFSDTCPTFAPHRSSSGNSMPAENRATNVNIGAAWWWEACKAQCAVFCDLSCLCASEFVGSRYCAVLAYVVSVCGLRVV